MCVFPKVLMEERKSHKAGPQWKFAGSFYFSLVVLALIGTKGCGDQNCGFTIIADLNTNRPFKSVRAADYDNLSILCTQSNVKCMNP